MVSPYHFLIVLRDFSGIPLLSYESHQHAIYRPYSRLGMITGPYFIGAP